MKQAKQTRKRQTEQTRNKETNRETEHTRKRKLNKHGIEKQRN